MVDKTNWSLQEWVSYYEYLVDFLYQSLGPADDDIMDMAEEYAIARMWLDDQGGN